jgi:hypothetical protein
MKLAQTVAVALVVGFCAAFPAACAPNVPDPDSGEWVCDTQADCLDDYSCLPDSPSSSSRHCVKTAPGDDGGND